MWSRRELLAALGASGASVALGPWLGACAGAEHPRRTANHLLGLEDLLPQLLEIVDSRLSGAFVWTRRNQRLRASKDSDEQHFDLEISDALVLGGDGHSIAIVNASREELLASAKRFVAKLPRSAKRNPQGTSALQLPALEAAGKKYRADGNASEFPRSLTALYAKSQGAGDSRIIYRNAYLLQDKVECRYLSRARNLRYQDERKRIGVHFAAWTGDDVVSMLAERAASGDLELAGPSTEALRRSADGALAHVHARSAPSGLQDVVLSSDCAALVAMRAIAMPGLRLGARPAPSGPLRVHNDPALPEGYGNFLRDARGDSPRRLDFFCTQSLAQMQHGNMQRDKELRLRPMPANVVVALGTASEQELIAEVKEGVFLDAPLHCSVDPLAQSLALLCGRGREIRNGRFTGRLFSKLIASAACQTFFAETRALGNSRRARAFEDEGIAMSSHSPAWLSRASVEAG